MNAKTIDEAKVISKNIFEEQNIIPMLILN